jgi:hypothetical protein
MRKEPCLTPFVAWWWLLSLLVFAVAGKSAALNPPSADAPNSANAVEAVADAQTGPATLAELDLLSAALIEKAAKGNTPAHQFRIEARIYRELLRRLMLDNQALPEQDRLPQNPLMERVRMSALLHSAADCKTGLVITCPPDLMRQLRSQQSRIDQEPKVDRFLPD